MTIGGLACKSRNMRLQRTYSNIPVRSAERLENQLALEILTERARRPDSVIGSGALPKNPRNGGLESGGNLLRSVETSIGVNFTFAPKRRARGDIPGLSSAGVPVVIIEGEGSELRRRR